MLKEETRDFIHVLYYVAQTAAEDESKFQLAKFRKVHRKRKNSICEKVNDIIGFEELKSLCAYTWCNSSKNERVDFLLNNLIEAAKYYEADEGYEEIREIIEDLEVEGYPLHFKPQIYVQIYDAM